MLVFCSVRNVCIQTGKPGTLGKAVRQINGRMESEKLNQDVPDGIRVQTFLARTSDGIGPFVRYGRYSHQGLGRTAHFSEQVPVILADGVLKVAQVTLAGQVEMFVDGMQVVDRKDLSHREGV